jgi:gamma-glutamyltranspeptidase/glutathione hydrolase
MSPPHRLLLVLLLVWSFGTQVLAQPAFGEPTSVLLEGDQHQPVRCEHAMVVSGEALSAEVGARILRQGGNAVDAAIAVGFAKAVTLPRAGNIGGGGFALVRTPDNSVYALDFRETAPRALYPEFYQKPDHSPVQGPTAAGVPGTVAGLWAMHQRFGKLPWPELVAPAVELAHGFPISAYECEGIAERVEGFSKYPSTAAIFLPGGKPPRPMQTFVQADLAKTLSRIAEHGADDFYRGETARLLVKAMEESGGVMTANDLAQYVPIWRRPLSAEFRGYTVFSMPPPSSGGLHLLQMLQMAEEMPTEPLEHNGARDIHRLTEFMRLAYADRARYLGDPDFVDIPIEKLLSPEYLRERQALIDLERAGDSKALVPELTQPMAPESFDTTHYNVVDENGMVVSLTYTLNFSFGSDYVAQGTGILMNNEMDDFNVNPGQPNSYGLVMGEKNKVEGRKRPVSSMTPTIVTRDGQFVASVGAPGGSRIITGVFAWLLNHLAYGFNAQTSSSLPRTHHQWFPDALGYEVGISPDTRRLLEARGHKLEKVNAVAHVLAIVRTPDGHLEAGLDPRRPAFAEGY